MHYRYSVLYINRSERWITIVSNDKWDCEEPDSFICLLKRIRDGVSGILEDIGETQYYIKGDGLELLYQWDGCFGISVIYPESVSSEEAIRFLKQFF